MSAPAAHLVRDSVGFLGRSEIGQVEGECVVRGTVKGSARIATSGLIVFRSKRVAQTRLLIMNGILPIIRFQRVDECKQTSNNRRRLVQLWGSSTARSGTRYYPERFSEPLQRVCVHKAEKEKRGRGE
jgi:hypothetical protein